MSAKPNSDLETSPEPEFTKAKDRLKVVPLEWPLKVNGQVLKDITLSRLTGNAISDVQRTLTEGSPQEELIAFFADQPAEVIGQLDQDDFFTLQEAVFDFLPRPIRKAMEDELSRIGGMSPTISEATTDAGPEKS